MSPVFTWLTHTLEENFTPVRLLKESSRSSIDLICHRKTRQEFILRRFRGNPEVYRKLLGCSCRHLPATLEVASQGEENLVLEEFVRGDTLGYLLRGSLFSPKETCETVAQVCQALWVLHSMAAVHRDVKPENVILRGREAVLIDFDAARLLKPEREADTQILGTTGFAAPEQYGLSQSDTRTDIYATGILINVMLTGEHPSKKLAEGRMGRIVTRCTQVNPKKRYQSVLQLMEAL